MSHKNHRNHGKFLNKNRKNPLMLSVAYGLHAAYMAMRLKASFHASPDAIMALHAKHRQQQRKNPPFGLKNSLKMYDVRCKRAIFG